MNDMERMEAALPLPTPESARDALARIMRIAFDGARSGADRLDEIGVIAGRALLLSDATITAYANAVAAAEHDEAEG